MVEGVPSSFARNSALVKFEGIGLWYGSRSEVAVSTALIMLGKSAWRYETVDGSLAHVSFSTVALGEL
nr:hypothetical protein Iba_chr04aCG14270 [Ipomoea batatas]